jgi:F-type H+-transporting ATPase subunit a
MSMLQVPREVGSLEPAIIGHVFGFPIANSAIFEWLVGLIFIALGIFIFRKFTLGSVSKLQTMVEIIYETAVEFIRSITGSDALTRRVFPLAGTLLIFIIVTNLLGLIPGLSSITFEGSPIFRTATTDFNTTLGLSVGSILIIHATMIYDQGFFGYLGNFIKLGEVYRGFKKGIGAGFMSLVDLFIGILDIIGEFAKIISTSLRLFGNMYAGEVLMTILVGIVAFVIPAAWVAMSLLSAVVQAVVFSALITVFFTLAVKTESHEA